MMSPAFTALGSVSTEMIPQPFFITMISTSLCQVKRNLCEVQWNGAQIGVVWKLGADVFFYFVEVFVGECVHNQDTGVLSNCQKVVCLIVLYYFLLL